MQRPVRVMVCRMLLFALLGWGDSRAATPTEQALQTDAPRLFQLYETYRSYVPGLQAYALQQGFKRPFVNLATVVHEMIHIASALHQGFFIDGTYYEPYTSQAAWPNLHNAEVMLYMSQGERGVVYSGYMRLTPGNGLGNILDEVNAYAHVLPFVCSHEPESVELQVRGLRGHLHAVQAYLRVARTMLPEQYRTLHDNRQSAGALFTITDRAVRVLTACGISRSELALAELEYFFGHDRPVSTLAK